MAPASASSNTEESSGKLTGKTVAVTGASGRLGRSLLQVLQRHGAEVIALSSSATAITLENSEEPIRTVAWQVGEEAALAPLLREVDILVINHGVNVNGDRQPSAIQRSYEINAFSGWRLLEVFLEVTQELEAESSTDGTQSVQREVWVNTSEAESNPAFSPLYELSKRTLGDLVTLRRLDAPCTIRKLILGPFKSDLNPVGVMSADWVAKQIVALTLAGRQNIVVTVNPLTFVTFPLKELLVSSYFRLFTRPERPQPTDPA